MKKTIVIHLFIICLIACKAIKEDTPTNPDLPPPFNGPGVSRERVLAIAAKYDLQDSLAIGYKPTTLQPPPEAAYQYLSEEFFDVYFQRWRKALDWKVRIEARRQKVNSLQTVQEYFAFVENDPEEYQSELEQHGGINGYKAFKKDVLAGKYHIYICNPEMGTVTTLEADGDYPGRIKGRLLQR
ncbi:MAG: hypothetical protein ABMA02_03350 [Saprospiraceae bacterium]